MKTLQINTTQNVKINFEMANVGQRLLAFVIDNIIKIAYVYLVIWLFDFTMIRAATEGDSWSVKAIDVLLFLPITFYSLYTEILFNGQTIGKKALNLKVINIDGFKPSTADFIIRWFMRIVDFNMFMLLFIYAYSLGFNEFIGLMYSIFFLGKMVGFLSIIITEKNQRIGDISANTVVISLQDKANFSQTILENISNEYKPTYPSVIKLSDNDARIIKDTFTEARKVRDYKTLIKLRAKIEEVTGASAKGLTDMQFIDTVLKDYNYYTQNM